MAVKNIGVLSPEAIKEFQKQKLLMLNRGGEVWVDEVDYGRAMDILKTVKNPVDQIYRFHGCLIRMPKDIVLEQKWYGYASNAVGRRGRIHIHEMAKPTNGLDNSDRAKTVAKVRIRKEEIQLGSGVYPPGYAGIVMCDDDGVPLFEVTSYNIWVLFDPKVNTEAARKIYDYMLMFAIVIANHSDEKSVKVWNEIWARQAPEREKWEIKQFEDMVVGSMKRELKGLEDQVNRRTKQVSAYQQSLYAEAKALSEDSLRLDVFKTGMAGSMEKKAREEWDKIKGLERNGAVRNIRVTSDRLSFQTREIKWTPSKIPSDWASTEGGGVVTVTGPVRLGIFEISVHLGGTFGIEIVNQSKTLTYKGIHWHHPHIQEGNVCKGNMTDALPTFAAKRDFEAIMMCMLKWLENVDTKDAWGRDIHYWIVDDNRRKEEEAAAKKRQEEEEKRKAEEAAKAEAEAKKKAEESAKEVSTASAQAPEAAKKEDGNGVEPGNRVPAQYIPPAPVDSAKSLEIKL